MRMVQMQAVPEFQSARMESFRKQPTYEAPKMPYLDEIPSEHEEYDTQHTSSSDELEESQQNDCKETEKTKDQTTTTCIIIIVFFFVVGVVVIGSASRCWKKAENKETKRNSSKRSMCVDGRWKQNANHRS